MTKVENVKNEEMQAIKDLSAYGLPDEPSAEGKSAAEIKAAFWRPIVDYSKSVTALINRVVNEINKGFEDLEREFSGGGSEGPTEEVSQGQGVKIIFCEYDFQNGIKIDCSIKDLFTMLYEKTAFPVLFVHGKNSSGSFNMFVPTSMSLDVASKTGSIFFEAGSEKLQADNTSQGDTWRYLT